MTLTGVIQQLAIAGEASSHSPGSRCDDSLGRIFVKRTRLATLLSVAPHVWALSSTGEIDVSVTDASEAAVRDARVSITGAENGALVRQLNTNAAGLPPSLC